MNTYNENLHATVVTSLQNVELEQKVLKSQVNASMFTLYHAEGALITAEEQLAAAKVSLDFKKDVKEQAVNDSNVSTNLLASATQANQYLNQSITNTAVSASNVQIATNAIVRLAGDIGTIYTIVNAADFKSEIYSQAEAVRDLMNDTAYAAEVTSQYAMEASMLTSEVSSSTVLDKSKAANAAMANLLGIATADFDTTSQIVTTDNATVASAYVSEKLAEGALEDISVDYSATRKAYNISNQELNINLTVPKRKLTNDSFTVTFDLMTGPFLDVTTDPKNPFYPNIIQDYYIIVVKERKKLTFSITNAESLYYNKKIKQFVHVKVPPPTSEIAGAKITSVSEKIDFLNMPGNYVLQDSDGDAVALGQNYVVFVMAFYLEDYKRTLNDFDNFLSAPSRKFCMTNKLSPVKANDIWTGTIASSDSKKPQVQIVQNIAAEAHGTSVYTHYLLFEIRENPDYPVTYNCMFLPSASDLTKGMLTKTSLSSILDEELTDIEQISEIYTPQIAELQAAILADKQQNELFETEGNKLSDKIKAITGSNPEKEKLEKELKLIQDQQVILQSNIKTNTSQLATLNAERAQAVRDLTEKDSGIPSFFFNQTIAEQVSAGNYTVAQPVILTSEVNQFDLLNEIKTKAEIAEDAKADKNMPATELRSIYSALIGPETTDNFGNPLIKGRNYIPVILSVSAAEDNNLSMFTNAMSEIKGVNPLEYFPSKK